MQTLTDPIVLLEKYIEAIPALNLDGNEMEEYSTVLLRLQNQLETGERSERIVKECLAYLDTVQVAGGVNWKIACFRSHSHSG
jgi:hypothetical protein